MPAHKTAAHAPRHAQTDTQVYMQTHKKTNTTGHVTDTIKISAQVAQAFNKTTQSHAADQTTASSHRLISEHTLLTHVRTSRHTHTQQLGPGDMEAANASVEARAINH